jgi:hypothetical protein
VEILGVYESLLSHESREHVRHYLDNAELEMACESFVLAMIEEGLIVAPIHRQELLRLCLTLRLDHESVFRSDFWDIAHPYLESSGID